MDPYTIVGVPRDTAPPATPAQLATLHRGTCLAAHLDGDDGGDDGGILLEPCTVCQTDLCDGSFAVGQAFSRMPGCSHCFHTGCLEHCLKDRFSCPTCFQSTVKKAYRKKSRMLHPDHAHRRGKTEAEANAEMDELNRAHGVLKDPAKRRHYDDMGEMEKRPAEFSAGTPHIKQLITREQHRAGGAVRVSSSGITTEVRIEPGQPLPIKIKKDPWPGQPEGAVITIDIEDCGPVERDFLCIELGDVDQLSPEELKDKIHAHRKLVVSCETLTEQAGLDVKEKPQHRKLGKSEFLRLPANLKKLRQDGDSLANAGADLVYTCELTGAYLHILRVQC
jgi:curved DNA-binding protein CbpA